MGPRTVGKAQRRKLLPRAGPPRHQQGRCCFRGRGGGSGSGSNPGGSGSGSGSALDAKTLPGDLDPAAGYLAQEVFTAVREDSGDSAHSSRRSPYNSSSTRKAQLYNTGLSDFLNKHVLGDQNENVSDLTPALRRRAEAATLAMKMAMDHFMFEGTNSIVRHLFINELVEESFREGETVCNQGDPGDKLYVVETGTIVFSVDGCPVGEQRTGGVFGELSLVYGIERSATAVCGTDCILWSLGLAGFRRIQSSLAMEALENSYRSAQRTLSSIPQQPMRGTAWRRAGVDFSRQKDISLLGQGAFGVVSLVRDLDTGRYYALKQLCKTNLAKAGPRQSTRIMSELIVLQECQSLCVTTLYDTHQDRDCVFFLTEYVQGGDLMSYMIAQSTLPDPVARFLGACLTEGIKHLHQKGFIHRDIKPENCLIATNGYLKVSDLGLAKRLPAVVEIGKGRTEISLLAFTMCGTPEFMAPEFCMSVGYDQGADWWAFGCVLYEMYMGRNPFDYNGDLKRTFKEVCMIGMGKQTVSIHPKFKEMHGDAAKLLSRCLTYTSNRIGKKADIQAHPYFQGINFADLRAGVAQAPYLPSVTGDEDIFHFYQNIKDIKREPAPVYDGDNEWAEFSSDSQPVSNGTARSTSEEKLSEEKSSEEKRGN